MDEEEFTLPALLVTDDVIQGLQSGSVSQQQQRTAACSRSLIHQHIGAGPEVVHC
jgi:hypothetical protein